LTVLAIYNLKGNEALLARQLATVLGKTVYETSSRVRAPGGGPSVIASFAEPGPAGETADLLRARGFDTLLVDEGDLEADGRRFVVRDFELGPEHMRVASRDSQMEVPWGAIELMLRGVQITRRRRAPAPGSGTTRKFSFTRAALSGGLLLTKPVPAARPAAVDEREGFLHLYGAGLPPLVWRENELRFQALGEKLQPSRLANFGAVVGELRRRCARAAWDERLATAAGQAQLLGPALSPDQYLDVAITLLAGALRQSV
jgi:hypothetical protein